MKKTALIAPALMLAQFVAAAKPYIVTEGCKDQTYEAANAVGTFINWDKIGRPDEILMSAIEVSGNSIIGEQISAGGLISAKNTLIIENSKFFDNSAYTSKGSLYGGIIGINGGILNVTGSEFSGNKAESSAASGSLWVYGTVASIRTKSSSANFADTKFDSNSAYSTYRVQGGVLHVYDGGSLSVENSSFTNNTAEAKNKARGAAVENYNAKFSATNTIFENNSVTSNLSSYGGAFFSSEANSVSDFTDVVFKDNSAHRGYGGAVSAEKNSTINFKATKDAIFSGNYATGIKDIDDARGGFMYLASGSKANFDISGGATLTIGDGRAGMDSIAAGKFSQCEITKTGNGVLRINSSMEDYKSSLNMEEGKAEILNTLGASAVSISSDAELVLLSGGWNVGGDLELDLGSSLGFILSEDFDEESEIGIYLSLCSVTLSEFKDISDAVYVKNHDGSEYTGKWFLMLNENGIIFTPNGTVLPEPSEYAALFGLCAMALAAYRRRK